MNFCSPVALIILHNFASYTDYKYSLLVFKMKIIKHSKTKNAKIWSKFKSNFNKP